MTRRWGLSPATAGEALTADDFVQSWRRVLNPAFATDNAWYLFALKNAEAYNAKKLAEDFNHNESVTVMRAKVEKWETLG